MNNITVFQICYGDRLLKYDMITRCMESVKAFALREGYDYTLFTPSESELAPGESLRYASDLLRIQKAAELTPCLYADLDIEIRPGFKIDFPERAMFGSPQIAFFYLPTPDIALSALRLIDDYKAKHKLVGGAVTYKMFQRAVWFDQDTYTHYQAHRYERLEKRIQEDKSLSHT